MPFKKSRRSTKKRGRRARSRVEDVALSDIAARRARTPAKLLTMAEMSDRLG